MRADSISASAFPLSPSCQALGLGFVGTGGLELRGRRGCDSLSGLALIPPLGTWGRRTARKRGGWGAGTGGLCCQSAVKNAEAGRRFWNSAVPEPFTISRMCCPLRCLCSCGSVSLGGPHLRPHPGKRGRLPAVGAGGGPGPPTPWGAPAPARPVTLQHPCVSRLNASQGQELGPLCLYAASMILDPQVPSVEPAQ